MAVISSLTLVTPSGNGLRKEFLIALCISMLTGSYKHALCSITSVSLNPLPWKPSVKK